MTDPQVKEIIATVSNTLLNSTCAAARKAPVLIVIRFSLRQRCYGKRALENDL
jgi:hypothetical protein